MRTLRRRLVVAALVGPGVLGLAACQTTKTTCARQSCTVTFGGGTGSKTFADNELGTGLANVPIRWRGTRDGTATVYVSGDTGTCTQGQTLTLDDFTVTCSEVGDDDLRITIRPS